MAIQYLLPCSCGETVPVETRQAGGTVVCRCGAKLDVPRLLEMKKLVRVAAPAAASQPLFAWGVGHSLMLIGLLVLAAVVGGSLYVITATSGDLYEGMSPEQVSANFAKMKPVETMEWWFYFKQFGLNPRKDNIERKLESWIAQRQLILTLSAITGACGVALVVGGALLVRRERVKRAARS